MRLLAKEPAKSIVLFHPKCANHLHLYAIVAFDYSKIILEIKMARYNLSKPFPKTVSIFLFENQRALVVFGVLDVNVCGVYSTTIFESDHLK
jgi:hypothetical protein